MFRTTKSLKGDRLLATDGEVGTVKDLYFDDRDWMVRYLVAGTGNWLTGRLVLIAPQSLGTPAGPDGVLPVTLTKKQIEESPSISSEEPVSRRYEREFHGYYGLAPYWSAPPPIELAQGMRPPAGGGSASSATATEKDSHLRSSREVSGYRIDAADDEIGHVEDFIIETSAWTIRYMMVDTKNWLPGRKVLVSPAWITSVSWIDHVVHVDLTREQVEGSPEFDPAKPIDRVYETQLHDHYGHRHSW